MIMRDDQGGCSQDNPPDIQVRGVARGAAKQHTKVGLSERIILAYSNKIIIRLSYKLTTEWSSG